MTPTTTQSAAPQSSHAVKPSLSDYTNFHGMLCGTRAAKRCIESFDGVALFADQSIYDETSRHGSHRISVWDYNNKPPLLHLNVVNYYLLVLLSLTGLCTLIGRTKILRAEGGLDIPYQSNKADTSVHSKVVKNLYIPPEAIAYLCDRSSTLCGGEKQNNPVEVTLRRRFEFDFGGYLSVMMLHFKCSNGRTHLVETYRVEQNTWVGRLATWLLIPLHWLRYLIARRSLIDTNTTDKAD